MTLPAHKNRKLGPSDCLAALHKMPLATSLNAEIVNLNLLGHYQDDPDPFTQSLYRSAYTKWGQEQPRTLRLVKTEQPTDFTGRTSGQVDKAVDLIHEDFSQCAHLPWDSLTRAIGHGILPYQLWTIAAASGHGKTTFAMNVVRGLVEAGKRVFMLGLEQAAPVLRVYLAALKLGFSTRYALANRWLELPSSAQGAIESELREQETEAELLHFSDCEFLTLKGLPKVLVEAKAFGADVVIVDHVHCIRGGGGNKYGEFEEICQTLHGFAKGEHIPVVGMAQLNRGKGPADRLRPYLPPDVDSIQMGKVLEQYSSVVLGLYRPLFSDLTAAERAKIRLGESVKPYLIADTMGVAVLKSRISGDVGEIVKLGYDRGRIFDREVEYATIRHLP